LVLLGRGQKREGGHGGAGPGRGRGCRNQGIPHHYLPMWIGKLSHKHFDSAVDPNPDPYPDPDWIRIKWCRDPGGQKLPTKI
jgi:hypothetical protein